MLVRNTILSLFELTILTHSNWHGSCGEDPSGFTYQIFQESGNEFLPLSEISYANVLSLTGGWIDLLLFIWSSLKVSYDVTLYVTVCTALGGCNSEEKLVVEVLAVPPAERILSIDELLTQVSIFVFAMIIPHLWRSQKMILRPETSSMLLSSFKPLLMPWMSAQANPHWSRFVLC